MPDTKKYRTVFIILCFLIITSAASIIKSPVPAYGLTGADVALYTDLHTNDSGVWNDGLTAIKTMLRRMNLTYEEIDYMDLNTSTQDFSSLYKVIFFPGGMAYHYNNLVCSQGKERIRDFIQNGGGYFGICAGAFFAVDQAIWDDATGGGNPVLYDDDTGYLNACDGPSGYSLDLFPGIGVGPINDIASFYGYYEGWAMTSVTFQTNTVLPYFKGSTGLKTMPFSEDIMYYGGPYFIYDQTNPLTTNVSNYQVLATYDNNSQAAIISFQYGSGKVVLSGPHPEIEEDSNRDNQNLLDYPYSPRKWELDDNGSDWELVSHLLDWIMNTDRPITYVMTPPQRRMIFSPGENIAPIVQTITNHSQTDSTVSLNTYLIIPGGQHINLNRFSIHLASGETRTLLRTFPVSVNFSAGRYVFGVTVRDGLNTIIDQDHLVFRVASP